MASLKEKTARGLWWGLIGSGGMQVLNLVLGIFLARLLSPSDYGVVGMIAIFTAIAGNLQDSGFTQALINSRGDERRDCSSVFWFNIVVSLALYALLWFSSPLIAAYFHQPCLVWLSRFVFLSFVFSAVGIVPGALMMRRLMVKERTLTMFIGLAVSGLLGIGLALSGFGYWSLAWQQVVYVAVVMVGRYYYVHWQPMLRPGVEPVRRMFGFSWKVMVTSVLTSVNQNVLTVLLGGRFTSRTVGSYTQAQKWTTMATQFLTLALTPVAQPVFRQAEEQQGQLRVLRKMLRFTAFISFPALFGLAIVAREFIVLLLGEKWEASARLLQILCMGWAFLPLYTVYQNLFLSRGRSNVYLWLSVVQMVLQLAAIVYCCRFGMTAMVAVYACITPLCLLLWQGVARRMVQLGWREFVLDIAPFFVVASVVMILTYVATAWIHYYILLLCARVCLAAALYVGVLRLLHAKILEECIGYLRKKRVA